MALFKCKMCGSSLEVMAGSTVVECEYCGTQQTLPKLEDDRRANLYDRANHFRRNNEFDKAMAIYEQILNEDPEDAESYWSIILCRYGIEYVEDPASHKRVPTVNRAQYTSIFADENYKSALKYADMAQKAIYESEAKDIDEIQKGILAISNQEEPFDVFICYKETDANGRRTPDSVLATDLYHQLTREGFKVFFARITLEDKIGTAYEPYIFAALNSAKVMVVIGTKPEYFNAVWVKNEWSRYLALIKDGANKTLIPAYKDMDPYDLPEEFSYLQAQDMSKLGFMQDLIYGIKKIERKNENNTNTAISGEKIEVLPAGNMIDSMIKRVFVFLEDADYGIADEYCEKILDADPLNGWAYLGKLMIECRITKKEELASRIESLKENKNLKRVLRFADDELKKEMDSYFNSCMERKYDKIYQEAEDILQHYNVTDSFEKKISLLKQAQKKYESITGLSSGWKDSAEKIKKCEVKIEELQFEWNTKNASIYEEGCEYVKRSEKIYIDNFSSKISLLEEAIERYNSLEGWKDSSEKCQECRWKIEELKQEAKNVETYKRACDVLERSDKAKTWEESIKTIDEAIAIFKTIENFRNTKAKLNECEEQKTYCQKRIRDLVNRKKLQKKITIGIVIMTTIIIGLIYVFLTVYPINEFDSVDYYQMGYPSSVTIPEHVTSIADGAFSGRSELAIIVISDDVKTIGDRAFYNCSNLYAVTISDGVRTIGSGAFMNCEKLSHIRIPASVKSIENDAFYNSGLEIVYVVKGSYAEEWAKKYGCVVKYYTP